jgi:hypothetical protein
MFRMSAGTVHTWQDFAKNIGKLSLAGLFLGGSFFLAHAQAVTVTADFSTQQAMHTAMPTVAPTASQQ